MVSDGFGWLRIVLNSFGCFGMVSEGIGQFRIVYDGFPVVSDGT